MPQDAARIDDAHIDARTQPSDKPRNDWVTPQPLWDALHREYAFTVDAAAHAGNTKCLHYFGPAAGADREDGLLLPWCPAGMQRRAASVWCNPPYNPKGSVAAWLAKALEQAAIGVRSVLLVPMATSTGWFNDLVVPYAEWHSFRGRIAFGDPVPDPAGPRENPKQDSLLVIFNPQATPDRVGHSAVRDAKTGERLWTRGALS